MAAEEQPTTSLLEERVETVKRYGVAGLVVILVPFFTPYIEDYLSKQQEDTMRIIAREIGTDLKTSIVRHIDKSNKVDVDTLVTITRLSVAKQSIHKVKFIKELLNKYEGCEVENSDRIKSKIKTELYRQSAIYVTFLNKFEDPVIGRIGDYIASEFPMTIFLEGVNAIALDTESSVDVRSDDIMVYMLDIQDTFFTEMERKMKRSIYDSRYYK